jgi:hypothetical protein
MNCQQTLVEVATHEKSTRFVFTRRGLRNAIASLPHPANEIAQHAYFVGILTVHYPPRNRTGCPP